MDRLLAGEGGFSARLPATPTEQVHPKTGNLNFQVTDNGKTYVVSVSYPAREVWEMPPQQILEKYSSIGLRLVAGSRLVKSEKRDFGGFPAILSVIESPAPEAKLGILLILAKPRFSRCST
jgi:hypothetical protein